MLDVSVRSMLHKIFNIYLLYITEKNWGLSLSLHSAAFLYLILKKNTAVRYSMNILGCMFMIHSLQLKLEKNFPVFFNQFFKIALLFPLPQLLQLYGFSQLCALGCFVKVFFFEKAFSQRLHWYD